jgi:hypothetical protein
VTTRTKLTPSLIVAVFVLAASAVTGCSGSDGDAGPAATAASEPVEGAVSFAPRDLGVASVELVSPVPEPPGPAAATPQDAVERFVAAEIDRDDVASWELLSSDSRGRLGVVAEWTRQHAQLPQFVTFVADPDPDPEASTSATVLANAAGTAQVVGTATLRPELNEVVGAVPDRATVTWTAVAEDGGWRVAFAETRFVPEWPDDASAPAAVERWIEARRRCEDPGALEYRAGIVGVAGLAQRLCDASGETRVGRALVLGTRPDPAPVLAAFGPGADQWARTVELSGPVDAHAVVAPLGRQWVVVGLLT